MELTTLRYFRVIAQAQHLTRAALQLGVTQPALSAMLKKLESEVGTPLVHRSGRGIVLTDAGRLFLEHAEEALRQADAAVTSVRQLVGLERGTIRVGGGATAITYILPPAISAFRKAHPGLHFYVREAGSNQIAASLLSGELDLGLVTLPLRSVGDDQLLKVRQVEDELRLIVPAGHRLDGRREFKWADLRGESVVGFEAGSAVRELIDRASAVGGVPLHVVMELRSIESIKQMVAAGVGVGFVSRFALTPTPFHARQTQSPRDSIAGLSASGQRLTRTIALVRRHDRELSPAAAAFERKLSQSLQPVASKA